MPVLYLRLTNSDGTNRCVVNLAHSIRTQEFKLKSTRVHHNGSAAPSSLRTCMVHFPWLTGFEVTSNVTGSALPTPVVPAATVTTTESNAHALLKAEAVPAAFTVELFRDDGVTPLNISNTPGDDGVSEINVLFEYSTNNNFI